MLPERKHISHIPIRHSHGARCNHRHLRAKKSKMRADLYPKIEVGSHFVQTVCLAYAARLALAHDGGQALFLTHDVDCALDVLFTYAGWLAAYH